MPGGGPAEICGVERGKAAPLVGGPPGAKLHTVVDEAPTGGVGDIVPVVLATTMDVGMALMAVGNGASAVAPEVPVVSDATGTVGVPGAI